MKIRLYMDEDSMREALVKALRTRGVDVVTASDERMIHRDDADHLDYATKQGRVLVTRNIQDFYELHTIYLTEGSITRASSSYPSNATQSARRCVGCSSLLRPSQRRRCRTTLSFSTPGVNPFTARRKPNHLTPTYR